MTGRLERVGSLCGLVFVGLVVAGAVAHGDSGNDSKSGPDVLSWYRAHAGSVKASLVLLSFAFAFLVFFAAALRRYLRREPSAEWLASVVLVGAALLAAGQTISAGFEWALASAANHLSADGAQMLHVATNDVVLTSAVGWFVFSISAGMAILRTGSLPRWLGWCSMAIGVVAVTPAEFVAFLGLVVWTAIASVMLLRRERPMTENRPDHVGSGDGPLPVS
jgi:hypothetical protein